MATTPYVHPLNPVLVINKYIIYKLPFVKLNEILWLNSNGVSWEDEEVEELTGFYKLAMPIEKQKAYLKKARGMWGA